MINTFEALIVLDINDDNQTGLKRRAFYQTLIDNRLTKELSTTWLVRYYENNNGQYGQQIVSEGISPYSRNLIANNDTLVDASQEGKYIAKKIEGVWINLQTGEEFTQEDIDANPYLYGEYDFFMVVAETQPSIINNIIRNAGMLASSMNRF